MNELPDLKKLERKMFQTLFQDGIYEFAFAVLFLGMALNPWLAENGISKAFLYTFELILAATIIVLGKRIFTVPRLGRVKFSEKRKKISLNILMGGILLNVLFLMAGFVFQDGIANQGNSNYMLTILFSFGFLLIFAVLAYLSSFPTLFLAGLLFATSIPVSEYLYPYLGEPADGMIPFGISALIILALGITKLSNFLNSNPKEMVEVSDV
ncbi:MAG: hypothetical protein K9N35_12360 [Candidatus Marinimicrobia bacterium]|nr:hypothetical protein [Candidatus Neomarinimicrobiota bacterium]